MRWLWILVLAAGDLGCFPRDGCFIYLGQVGSTRCQRQRDHERQERARQAARENEKDRAVEQAMLSAGPTREAQARAAAIALFERARTAARTGDCAYVKKLAIQVQTVDVAYHDAVFRRQPAILGCLASTSDLDANAQEVGRSRQASDDEKPANEAAPRSFFSPCASSRCVAPTNREECLRWRAARLREAGKITNVQARGQALREIPRCASP